ncbi:MAG: diguanylate cyclase [Candidatus Aegiribacteria sp.]|nr:diguanylate cyclase [Candidatus Aegiribacteria sp.]MBD3294742.1 diguanylate cyclase [Candidatus Fermentibacteria bacterium]
MASEGYSSRGIDALTGLDDRSYLNEIDDEYKTRDGAWSLLMIDVDHFKLINDIYGHLIGDKVLKQTALTIQVNLKETDTAVRFGGDEFIVILPDTNEDGALDLAQRLIYEVRRVSFTSGLQASISIGVSQSRSGDTSIMDLVSRSDKALYRAKESGRGRFYFFSEDRQESNKPDVSLSHLVGRRPELKKLRQLLEESVSDSSRIALITGETGVGKTRLVEELLNYCDFMKTRVLRNSALEHTQAQPFALIIDPVKELLAGLSRNEFDTVCGKIEPVHPATLDFFPELEASVSEDTEFFMEERTRFRVFRDMAAILAAASVFHPLTVIIDDIQWISEPDLSLLSFVSRNTPEANIMYIFIMRTTDSGSDVLQKLQSIRNSVPLLHVKLRELNYEEIRNLILFSLKDPNVPPEVLDVLIAQSGGNPLFLRELLRSCVEKEYISCNMSGDKVYNLPEDLDIPDSVGKIITLKLSAISEDALELLRIVSISPDGFQLSLLESVTGRERVELARLMDQCIKKGIVEEHLDRSRGIRFSFAYGAVRDYLMSQLPESLKRTYHQRIAEHYESLYREGSTDLLTAVAFHYSRSHDDENASRYALLAAQQAFRRGANLDSIKWYNVHLERKKEGGAAEEDFMVHINLGSLYSITGQVEQAENSLKKALEKASSPREYAAVYLRLGRNSLNRSLYPSTLEYYGKVVEICRGEDLEDPILLRTLIETHIGESFVHRLQGNYDVARESLARAWSLLEKNQGSLPEDLIALYFTRKADVVSELHSEEQAIELYRKALNIYRSIDELPGQGTVLNNMHGIFMKYGDYDRSLDTLEEVLRINTKLDDRLGLAIAYYNLAEYYQEINMLDLAREYYDKYMEMNDAIENQLGNGYGEYGLGKLCWLDGRLEESESHFQTALEIFRRLSVDQMKMSCDLMIAQIFLHMDRFDEARRILNSIEDSTVNPTVEFDTLYMKGLILLYDGDSNRTAAEKSLEIFSSLTESMEELSEVETAMYYSARASALKKLDRIQNMKDVLREGSSALAEKLDRISSFSTRNSILKRREIAQFLDQCKRTDIPFPPEGFRFSNES